MLPWSGAPGQQGWYPAPAAHRRTSVWLIIGAVVSVVALLAVIGIGATIGSREVALPPGVPTGQAADVLDSRLPTLQVFVEDRVGVPFDSPPQVSVLPDKEFEDQLMSGGSSSGSPHTYAEGDWQSTGEALGLIDDPQRYQDYTDGGYIDGAVGFYQPSSSKLYVRGAEWGVGVEITIVHELTHALQDQELQLDSITAATNAYDDSYLAALAMIEGQATVVENDWMDAQGAAYTDAYRREMQQAYAGHTRGDPLGEAVSYLPYQLGPRAIETLEAQYGPAATLQAVAEPPTTLEQVWDPVGWKQHTATAAPAVPVTAPAVPDGAELLDHGSLGVHALSYLVTDEESWAWLPDDDQLPLSGWAGDSYVTYQTPDAVCTDLTVRFDPGKARVEAFTAFTKDGGTATATGDDIRLHRCTG